jgi:hypothetical protein
VWGELEDVDCEGLGAGVALQEWPVDRDGQVDERRLERCVDDACAAHLGCKAHWPAGGRENEWRDRR